MIVKVQIDATGTKALIYNKDRSVLWQEEDLLTVATIRETYGLDGAPAKKYAHAEMVGTRVMLGDEAPWQTW